MNSYVIDTNVLVVANGRDTHLAVGDIRACGKFLHDFIQSRCMLTIDNLQLIFKEYLRYTNLSGKPGTGDIFIKWLNQNRWNEQYCEQVKINPINQEKTDFAEFPRNPELATFDPSDRKFVAVALASKHSPSICNACDSDWEDFRQPLEAAGVKLINILTNQATWFDFLEF